MLSSIEVWLSNNFLLSIKNCIFSLRQWHNFAKSVVECLVYRSCNTYFRVQFLFSLVLLNFTLVQLLNLRINLRLSHLVLLVNYYAAIFVVDIIVAFNNWFKTSRHHFNTFVYCLLCSFLRWVLRRDLINYSKGRWRMKLYYFWPKLDAVLSNYKWLNAGLTCCFSSCVFRTI